MAILSSTGVSGFLSSAKATGKQILNKAGKLIPEYIEDFVSGFAGHGWKIWERVSGIWRIETDELVVRRTMIVFEMLISKIRCIKGALNISQGNGKIKTAELKEDGNWYITIEDEMSFVAHDIIRCQHFSNMAKFYWVEITDIINDNTTLIIPATEFMGSLEYKDGIEYVAGGGEMNIPEPGDEIIQFGNRINKDRQSAIYLHADEGGQPAIDILFNINSKSFEGCLNMRMGGSIPGEGDMKGFYCENGMIKGTVDNHVVYQIKPDGSAMFGDGSAQFNADKSGCIAGGTISWKWDESKGKYVCTMQDVVLTWDNLSDEAKENLKGDKGDKGNPGMDGINGINGEDGVSLFYKGDFDSHPVNPQNGWYYRNTTDKKCYVYQDDTWYLMTVDGMNGKDGMNGINGKDGNDGLSIIWKGDSATPPTTPQKNWVYRDTDNGRVYIYNGMAWELMIADGNNGVNGAQGTDGLSVFITYNDDPDDPDLPTGDGTTEGWHTDATSGVVWMSQKVAEHASLGTWGSPIRIKGEPGNDAVIYEIITPVAVIRNPKKGMPYPSEMKYSIKKTIGNRFVNITTNEAMTTEGLALKYITPMDENYSPEYLPWSIEDTMSAQYFQDGIKLRLLKGNSIVSQKELPEVADGLDGKPGASVYKLDLTNDNASIPCDQYGNLLSLSDLKELAKSTVQLYLGATEVENAIYNVSFETNFTDYSFITNGNGMEFTLNNMSAGLDPMIVTFTASISGVVVATTVMTITKVCAGVDGIPATIYYLICSPSLFSLDKDGDFKNGNTLTIKAYKKTGVSDPVICADGEVFISARNDRSDDPVTSTSGTLTISADSNSSSILVLLKNSERTIILDEETIPILVDGQDGQPGVDADVPDWLKKWNGYATEIGSEYIVTPTMFSGVKSADGTLTGVAQGKDCITIDGVKHSGMFGLKNGEIVFSIDDAGNVNTTGNVIASAIKASGLNVNDNFKVDKDGNVFMNNMTASGKIQESYRSVIIDSSDLSYILSSEAPNIVIVSSTLEYNRLGIDARYTEDMGDRIYSTFKIFNSSDNSVTIETIVGTRKSPVFYFNVNYYGMVSTRKIVMFRNTYIEFVYTYDPVLVGKYVIKNIGDFEYINDTDNGDGYLRSTSLNVVRL